MDKIKIMIASIAFIGSNVHATSMSLEEVLQSVIDNYPSIQIAALQVDRVNQNSARILSRLGWRLSAQAGIASAVSFVGKDVQQATLGTKLERVTASGNTFSVSAQSNWDNSEQFFNPSYSNRGTVNTALISYRQPLQKGKGNIAHQVELASNAQLTKLAKTNLIGVYDQLALQITNMYFAAAGTLSRLRNIEKAIRRTQRLKKFISGRLNLGIAENKDQLQVDAQYKSQYAQLKALQATWIEQQIDLNQLMGKSWDHKINVTTSKTKPSSLANMTAYLKEITLHDPQLEQINAEIRLAQSQIKLQRENLRNTMDVVMHIGQQFRSRDFPNDSNDYSETIGGIRIEYNKALDKSGSRATLYQAKLDQDISLQAKQLRQIEIRYELASLLASLEAERLSAHAYQDSIKTEKAKLTEADSRYRRGRIDIDLLLQYKAQLSTAELSHALQLIQVNQREYQLKRLDGRIWHSIRLPTLNPVNSSLQPSNINKQIP